MRRLSAMRTQDAKSESEPEDRAENRVAHRNCGGIILGHKTGVTTDASKVMSEKSQSLATAVHILTTP